MSALILGAAFEVTGQVRVLDNFNSGDIAVTNTVTSTFGDPVPGVFGGNRYILMSKAVESSATSITVGSGVLTWNGTAQGDYGHVGWGTASTLENLSQFNAFRLSVVSAPQNPGQLELNFGYYGSPTQLYGVYALATLPASGTVDIPFSSLIPNAGFPPIDFTRVHDLGLTFRGNLLAQGTYVFDNFQAIVVPEPSTIAFMVLAICGLFAVRALRTTGKHCESQAKSTASCDDSGRSKSQ